MARIRLRFGGRFVLAEHMAGGAPTGELAALGIRVKSDTKEHRHRVLMTIARDNMADTQPKNFLPPMLSTIGPTEDEPIEHLTWDLAGWDVTFDGLNGGFSWSDARPAIPNLTTLEQKRQRHADLNPKFVRAVSSAVACAIRIAGGTAITPLTSKKEYTFVPKNKVQSNGIVPPQAYADFADVSVPLAKLRIVLIRRDSKRTRKAIDIRVPLKPDVEESVVRFSNLCASAPAGIIDGEFADYYALFKHDAKSGELLVAKESAGTGGIGIHCFLMLHATY
jgi:hypothetical protein